MIGHNKKISLAEIETDSNLWLMDVRVNVTIRKSRSPRLKRFRVHRSDIFGAIGHNKKISLAEIETPGWCSSCHSGRRRHNKKISLAEIETFVALFDRIAKTRHNKKISLAEIETFYFA